MKEKQAIQEAFTELSSHYEEAVDGELNLFWGWSYHKFLEELVNQTTFQENQKILDIATGTLVIPRKILKTSIKQNGNVLSSFVGRLKRKRSAPGKSMPPILNLMIPGRTGLQSIVSFKKFHLKKIIIHLVCSGSWTSK